MNKILTKGLDKSQKEDLERLYRSSFTLRNTIVKVLQDRINGRLSSMTDREDFSSSGWDYKNAYDIGYMKALKEVISIISDKSEI